uniref:methyltransferase domain-containing protein n=1 Tax=Roseivirga sp. TaxID=1964215 RepID=UPI0040481FD4
MKNLNAYLLKGVEQYYSKKLKEHGALANGVDWNSIESQHLRFHQLSKVIDFDQPFSLLDYGCGYGEYLNYLKNRSSLDLLKVYWGYDISHDMVNRARSIFCNIENTRFTSTYEEVEPCDYLIASGLFNVKMDLASSQDWNEYIIELINVFNRLANKGFSFNALTMYSDKDYMKDYLYYANPLELFDYCKKNFSKDVALLHDYGLYEFTIIVRK